jgi:hypothetical protein
VGCVQHMEHGGVREGAPSVVGIGHNEPKRTLPESGKYCHRITVAGLRPFAWLRFLSGDPHQWFDSLPNVSAVTLGIVSSAPDDLPFPVRQRNPVCSIKEEWGLQENTANLVIVRCTRNWGSSIPGDS